jgi:transposase
MDQPSHDTENPPRRYPIAHKIALVRQTLKPGASVTQIARDHGIAVSVLYYWRKAFRELVESNIADSPAPDPQVAQLRAQLRELEALLGERTREVAQLRKRLGLREAPVATRKERAPTA